MKNEIQYLYHYTTAFLDRLKNFIFATPPFFPYHFSHNYHNTHQQYHRLGLAPLGLLSAALLCVPSAYALSATTAATIQGHQPYLTLSDGTKLSNLNELVGFSMPKRDGTAGTEFIDASMAGTALVAPARMKFSDITALVAATGTSMPITGVNVLDDDGDAANGVGRVNGTLTVSWKNNGRLIPPASQNQTLVDCGGPYTLEITVDSAISAQTPYGDPSVNVYGTNPTVTYTFVPQSLGICYIQPAEMGVYANQLADYSKWPITGYNPDLWVKDKGFSTDLMSISGRPSGFPTTGFNKAEFILLGSGSDQRQYRCRSVDDINNGGNKIILSGAASSDLGENCTVTYNARTKAEFIAGGTPTIKMEYNNGSTWVEIDSYHIPAPKLWARPAGVAQYNTAQNFSGSYPAAQACDPTFRQTGVAARTAASAFFFTRAELTNTPVAKTNGTGGLFARDLDTFTGEWGNIYLYTGSGWFGYNYFWTAEAHGTAFQFNVVTNGNVNSNDPAHSNIVAVCRG